MVDGDVSFQSGQSDERDTHGMRNKTIYTDLLYPTHLYLRHYRYNHTPLHEYIGHAE